MRGAGNLFLKIEVLDQSYRKRLVTMGRRGIFWNGSWATPISLKVRMVDPSKDIGRTLGGAAIGGVLAGGAGAIVGAVASGNKGKTLFSIVTVEGDELLCRCSGGQYPKIGGLMPIFLDRLARWKQLQQSGDFGRDERLRVFLLALFFGPFFFAVRFGLIAFLFALIFTLSTAFFGWFVLPFVALFIHHRERNLWLKQHGFNLASLDISALRMERQLNFEAEHGF
jgi:hypothetical protein